MTKEELEAYDAMMADRDQWKERAEKLERLSPLDAAACSPSYEISENTMNKETPETDAEAFVATYDYWEAADVVRVSVSERLELERNEARKAAEHYRNLYYLPTDGLEAAKNHPLPWENA